MFITKIYDLVKGSAHNLTNLGVRPDSNGKLLVPLLIEKNPVCFTFSLFVEFDDKLCELENMLKYFKKEIFAMLKSLMLIFVKKF